MRGGNSQVWVTSALTAEEVRHALVLGVSLKGTLTTRKVAIIVYSEVEGRLRTKLYNVFDLVICLDESENITGLKLEDFAKLTALPTLTAFDQAVYLSPRMLAVRNSDKIFEKFEVKELGDFVLPQDETLTMFLMKPSVKLYNGIMDGLLQLKSGTVIDLCSHLRRQFKSDGQTIPAKYTQKLQIGKIFLWSEDLSFINLSEIGPIADVSSFPNFGVIGKSLLEYWRKIDESDVQPLIQANRFHPHSTSIAIPQYVNEPIAIVGMSCRFPGSKNLEEFWNLLNAGGDGTSTAPPFRWLREQSTRTKLEYRKTNAGFLSVPVNRFDAKFFGVSPKEVECMDPQHRLLYEVVWEGLENACINPHQLKGTPGSVFLGSWTNDFKDILNNAGKGNEVFRMYMGNSVGAAAARISHLLEIVGPSVATESGCSSAMVAVHLACGSLQKGETNMALACGVNLLLHPFANEEIPMVVSPEGRCKTFCEKADGFARAEGCGVLVLKRLSDAVRDNDNIWAMIRGSAMTQEGISKSMGTPTVHCESLSMIGAIRDAQVGPEEVTYVETHGTGTEVGDPMEVAAIAKAYNSSLREQPLLIGSVKTNVGHTESCSGITGIIKVALAMHHETIPPHRNFEKLNPAIDLGAVPAKIPLEPVEWKGKLEKPRIAGVSSFGITGTDAHVILEESPTHLKDKVWKLDEDIQRPVHLIKLSAKSEEALGTLLKKYQETMSSVEERLEDVAYSGNVGRANFSHRVVIIAKSKEELVANIQQEKFLKAEVLNEDAGKICFLFTGQGSQYPGMAKQLYETSPVFRIHFDFCDKILRETYSIKMKEVMWGSDKDKISRTIYSQTSIFCVEYALLKLWESWGVRPDYALGHSLGEFAAAVCAGILHVEDALKLMAERSRLIDQLPGGKMLVIKADKEQVSSAMKRFGKELDYAAINSKEQTVVAGDSEMVLEFSRFCCNNGMKSIILDATHAFHSKHMDPMLKAYEQIVSTVEARHETRCEYISGMRGHQIPATDVNADYWVQHTRDKVSFLNANKQAVELGCRVFIEIGPQPVLSALTMLNNDVSLTCLPSMKKTESEWVTILNSLGQLYLKGVPIDWEGFDRFYTRTKVSLPTYPFIGKKFWPDLMNIGGSIIHPLLGSSVPNASSSKLFQCGLNLSTHGYIRDHAIGDNVVVPGAGFLEMCLAAGLATIENAVDSLGKPTRPMKVEDLQIEAPLSLQESKTTEVQTVVGFNTSTNSADWNDMSIKIFQRMQGDSASPNWLSHAKATFSPLPTAEEQQVSFDINEFQQRLKQESNENEFSQVQEKLVAIGLKFGPSFKRLEKVWKSEEDSTLLVKVSNLPQLEGQQQCNYIIHPTILDAMIQSTIFARANTSNVKKKLPLPIRIGKFVWLAGNETENAYIYAYDPEHNAKKDELSTSTCAALLLDGNGKVLAIMSGVEFIDTTVKALEAVLEQQTVTMPDLWEETWRAKLGPNQHRANLQLCSTDELYDEDFCQRLLEQYNVLDDGQQATFDGLERLVYCNMLQALYELGWAPPLPGTAFSGQELVTELGIHKNHLNFFNYMLQLLQDEGVLEQGVDSGNWKVSACFPALEQVKKELSSQSFIKLADSFKATRLMRNLGEQLSQILMGNQSPLPILFPDESKPNHPSVGDFYEEYGRVFKADKVVLETVGAALDHWKQQHVKIGEKFVMRILEVGAGTGGMTHYLLRMLEEREIEFEFTFTDISAAFFLPAQKMFEKHKNSIQYKILNVEEDPIDQGFIPGYYDFVCASEVIHATRDVREALRNIRSLMRPFGTLHIQETTRVNRFLTYLFGLLEGFWRFTDKDLRPSHCSLSPQGWRKAFEFTGFEVTGVFPSGNYHHSYITTRKSSDEGCSLELSNKIWLLFHHEHSPISNFLLRQIPLSTNRHLVVVRPGTEFTSSSGTFTVGKSSEQDFISIMEAMEGRTVEGIIYCWSLDRTAVKQDEVLLPYFYLAKSLAYLKQSSCPRLLTFTSGVVPIDDSSLVQIQTSTIWGFTKSLLNENTSLNCRLIDIGDGGGGSNEMQFFYEIWNVAKDTQIAYSRATRYLPSYQPLKASKTDLKLPAGSDRFQLVLPESNSIQDLQFGPLDPYVLEEEEVEIQVKASALNFRDIFSVLKPTEEFKQVNDVGFDLAGVVKRVSSKVTKWSVGDEVFGINIHGGALPSHVKLNQDDMLSVPADMTLCEASTLPAVFATSYYCLVEVAKVTSNDTVLIHTASGGVGLSAVQICQHIGAKIICTAGSKRKQNYLRSLGIQHIFHSRNTKYGEKILEVTGGHGVDVVLNSLTSEGFKEATLLACAKGARFVEMSKLFVWQPNEVRRMRPDVDYTIVDLSAMKGEPLRKIMSSVKPMAEQNVISPIPYVRFDAAHIREALQYMQKAKHIGKVVCVMPEMRRINEQSAMESPMFNPKSTYLITGGLGGIGFEVCKWMVEKGAKYVVLAGRNPPNSSTQEAITQLNSKYSAKVTAVKLDVGNFSECKELLHNKIPKMGYPTLRGVMHCAGILQNGLIENMDWPKLSSTLATKVDGTLNLHELTKHSRLEHFVLFSSIAALFGSPGQSNHAAGNNFEDTFAHYRNSIGLPVTSINWGQWGQVGIAAEVDIPGLKPLSNLRGIAALEFILKSHRTQTCALNIESFVLLAKLVPYITSYLDERVWKVARSDGSTSLNMKSEEFWELYDSKGDNREEKLLTIKDLVRRVLRYILRLDETDAIQDNQNFQDMGMDSLMYVEIKNSLQSLFGERVTLNASALRDCTNLELLSAKLVKLIEKDDSIEETNLPPTMEEVASLIREDCELPEHIHAQPGQIVLAEWDIQSVLLTGCTGTLGPYILRELCALPQISRVICLMRPATRHSSEERLESVLRERDLQQDIDMGKVSVVSGDMTKAHLGLDSENWNNLSHSIDAIFHCAASVQHMEHYRKQKSTNPNDMRAVNIQGIKNVLELSCSGSKLKHVFYTSSTLAVSKVDEEGILSEDWPEIEWFDGLTTAAYPITKFVGEILVKKAIDRGLPAKVLRFPLIVGDSTTGRFVLNGNHVMLRYLFILKTGMIPSVPLPMQVIPVDTCANVGVKLFFDERCKDDIINVLHNRPDMDQEFVHVATKLGYEVQTVEFSEFAKKLRDSSMEDSPFAIFKEAYQNDDELLELGTTVPSMRQWVRGGGNEGGCKFFTSKKMLGVLPDFYEKLKGSMDCIHRDLLFAREQGWLQQYGLK